ncbi:hypothetical protein [Amycolatopsis kentuckyensis]|uniref:hypothetical protein n=1 Tax=Amycolatopsis kentuckyensis TaxID=218823 RepID=UPI003564E9B0
MNYAHGLQVVLLATQRAIFEDLAWQHEAFVQAGAPELAATSGAPAAAWQDIASGDPVRVRRGNHELLLREQKTVVAPYYGRILDLKDFDLIPDQMSREALSPIPGGKPFREVVPGGDTPQRRRRLVNTRWPTSPPARLTLRPTVDGLSTGSGTVGGVRRWEGERSWKSECWVVRSAC